MINKTTFRTTFVCFCLFISGNVFAQFLNLKDLKDLTDKLKQVQQPAPVTQPQPAKAVEHPSTPQANPGKAAVPPSQVKGPVSTAPATKAPIEKLTRCREGIKEYFTCNIKGKTASICEGGEHELGKYTEFIYGKVGEGSDVSFSTNKKQKFQVTELLEGNYLTLTVYFSVKNLTYAISHGQPMERGTWISTFNGTKRIKQEVCDETAQFNFLSYDKNNNLILKDKYDNDFFALKKSSLNFSRD